jgi:hypothetical protein
LVNAKEHLQAKKPPEINLILLSGTFYKGEGKWMQSVSP